MLNTLVSLIYNPLTVVTVALIFSILIFIQSGYRLDRGLIVRSFVVTAVAYTLTVVGVGFVFFDLPIEAMLIHSLGEHRTGYLFFAGGILMISEMIYIFLAEKRSK